MWWKVYEWLCCIMGILIMGCLLKWWLNGVWSENITWINFISLYATLCMVVIVIYFISKKSLDDFFTNTFGCIMMTGAGLGVFPMLVLYPVYYEGIGARGTEELMQEEWWNPLTWGECWYRQMAEIGWVAFIIVGVVAVILLVYVIKANWKEWEWMLFSVLFVCAIVWYAPFIIFLLRVIVSGVINLILSLGGVLSLLSPE